MISHHDIMTEKIIVIGFTGPIASGCTTLSKFLADEIYEEYEGIFAFLLKNNYITNLDSEEINRDLYNDNIDYLLDKKSNLEDKLNNILQNNDRFIYEADIKKWEDDLLKVHYEVKNLLEKREYTNSLDFLLDINHYKNCKRISCSSIILFDVIRNIDFFNLRLLRNTS